MSQPKDDIDERPPEPGDLLLVNLLYGELSGDARDQAEQTLKDNAREPDLAALTELRALFRHLPDKEPPAAITAKLLHAAALHAPASAAEKGAAGQNTGVWAWFSNLFRPVLMYPGLAAAASLVLIVLVGSSLYLAGKTNIAEPEIISAPPPAAVTTAPEPRPTEDVPAASSGDTTVRDLAKPEDDPAQQLPAADADALAEGLAAPSGNARGRLLEEKKAPATKAKPSVASGSSRTARMYEGHTIASKDDHADGFALGGAAAGSNALAQTKASAPPLSRAVPDETPAPTPAADDDQAPRQERAPLPARTQAQPSKKKSADKSPQESDAQSRIRSLHDEARTAASRGDCKTVSESGAMIQNLDARYYRDAFRTDKVLAACLSAKVQP